MSNAAAGDVEGGFALQAWVDESMHFRTGLYLLAAVVCDASSCDLYRQTLRSLLDRSQPTLHWRNEGARRRTKIIESVTTVDMTAVVVIGTPMDHRRQERARAVCMETLAMSLAEIGVANVMLEAREARLNDRDQRLIESIRGKKLIPSSIRFEVGQPSTEPMLWLPDIVAGAVGHELVKGSSEFLDPIRRTVTQLHIALR